MNAPSTFPYGRDPILKSKCNCLTVILLALVLAVALLAWFYSNHGLKDSLTFLNVVFTGFAAVVVLVALLQQAKDSNEQRKLLIISAYLNALTARIQAYNDQMEMASKDVAGALRKADIPHLNGEQNELIKKLDKELERSQAEALSIPIP